MVYHFVKHVGFDIKADSLEQAKKIAKAIDECDGGYNRIEDVACDTMLDAIDDVVDADDDNYDDIYEDSFTHAGETEYVGYTEEKNTDDPEERLYDYLTGDADDEDDDDATYRLTDKGRDWLDFVEGKYPQYNENDYDSHGNRLLPRRDGSIEDQLVRVIVSALLGGL